MNPLSLSPCRILCDSPTPVWTNQRSRACSARWAGSPVQALCGRVLSLTPGDDRWLLNDTIVTFFRCSGPVKLSHRFCLFSCGQIKESRWEKRLRRYLETDRDNMRTVKDDGEVTGVSVNRFTRGKMHFSFFCYLLTGFHTGTLAWHLWFSSFHSVQKWFNIVNYLSGIMAGKLPSWLQSYLNCMVCVCVCVWGRDEDRWRDRVSLIKRDTQTAPEEGQFTKEEN